MRRNLYIKLQIYTNSRDRNQRELGALAGVVPSEYTL